MCGIAGYIGESTKPKVSYELITALFDYLELRGTDAAGLWGVEAGDKGRIFYHKEPLRSSEFIKIPFWKKMHKIKTNLLLIHARAASKGARHAIVNANNHPFVSADCHIGMVHNGQIDEATFLKEKYEVYSDTDSEYLLRIYEHGHSKAIEPIDGIPDEVSQRLSGIRDIWSVVSSGAMAVAFGECVRDRRYLFLFHNDKRPLWLVDLRDALGQVFFFSSPDIWFNAVSNSGRLQKHAFANQKLIEMPINEVWAFYVDDQSPSIGDKNFHRFTVQLNDSRDWAAGDFCPLKEPKEVVEIVSNLDEQDEVIIVKKPSQPSGEHQRFRLISKDNDDQPQQGWQQGTVRHDHDEICTDIKSLLDQINTTTTNMAMEGSLTADDYDILLESLEQVRRDLQGTARMVHFQGYYG